jgi:hypothetical protein
MTFKERKDKAAAAGARARKAQKPEEAEEQHEFERMLSNADDISPDILVRHLLSSMGQEGFNFLSAEYLQATQVLATLAVADSLYDVAKAISEDSQYS